MSTRRIKCKLICITRNWRTYMHLCGQYYNRVYNSVDVIRCTKHGTIKRFSSHHLAPFNWLSLVSLHNGVVFHAVFYRCFHGFCSSQHANCIPPILRPHSKDFVPYLTSFLSTILFPPSLSVVNFGTLPDYAFHPRKTLTVSREEYQYTPKT